MKFADQGAENLQHENNEGNIDEIINLADDPRALADDDFTEQVVDLSDGDYDFGYHQHRLV